MTGILDYGMGNLRSVYNAFVHIGHAAEIVRTPQEARRCDRVVLPGVGTFADAVETLRQTGLDDAVRDHIAAGRPFLGICLGLQMLFDVGYEDGTHAGLGILSGECVRLQVDAAEHKLKVPHMGWNQLEFRRPSPLLQGVADGSNVYFVHGYHVVPTDPQVIATVTDYGRPFVSSVWKDNLVATQFHPEKSQAVGLTLVKNFAAM